MENERVAIFIDGSNLYHGLKNTVGKVNLDFCKFSRKLCGDRKLIRTYFYICPVQQKDNEENYKAQQKFFVALDEADYLTKRLGNLQKRGETWIEKGVDVKIAVDMLSMAVNNLYDTAILISGDGDFADAIEAVKNLGKHVEVAYVSQTYRLKSVWDKFIPLTSKFLRDCLYSKS